MVDGHEPTDIHGCAPEESSGDSSGVFRLAQVIETQISETRKNTEAFTQINGKLAGLQKSVDDLKDELSNGGFNRLGRAVKTEVSLSEQSLVNEMKSTASSSCERLERAIRGSGTSIPRIGWVAIALFFLLMLVAMGVKIQEILELFGG